MPKYYTTIDGVKHELVGQKTKEYHKISELDRLYYDAALETAKMTHMDVFYCLKKIDPGTGLFISAQYFSVPIVRAEVDLIAKEFGEHHWIGIAYREKVGLNWQDYEKSDRPPTTASEPMSGEDFEKHCAEILSKHGFTNIKLTPKTGDHGADILAQKSGELYAIQCKRYSGNVGNKAIQEIYTAKDLFHAQHAIVMTNSSFTQQAKDDAKRLGVQLFEQVRV